MTCPLFFFHSWWFQVNIMLHFCHCKNGTQIRYLTNFTNRFPISRLSECRNASNDSTFQRVWFQHQQSQSYQERFGKNKRGDIDVGIYQNYPPPKMDKLASGNLRQSYGISPLLIGIYIYIYIYICIWICICICICICMCICVCVYVCVCVCIRMCIWICIWICMCTCMYMYMYMDMYMYVYIYNYIHTFELNGPFSSIFHSYVRLLEGNPVTRPIAIGGFP